MEKVEEVMYVDEGGDSGLSKNDKKKKGRGVSVEEGEEEEVKNEEE